MSRSGWVCSVVLVLAIGCKSSKARESASVGSGSGSGAVLAGTDAAHVEVATGSSASAAIDAAAGSGAPIATAPARPQAVADFEAVLVPLVNEPEGDARSRKTCAQLMTLQKGARALAMNKPNGIDAAAWQEVNDQIMSSIHGLGPYCNDDPPDDSVELPGLHEHFKRLVALLPATR